VRAQERPSYIDLAIIAPLAAAAALCAALILPVLWTAITEIDLKPKLTYQACPSLSDGAARLNCYDRVRRNSLSPAKYERPS